MFPNLEKALFKLENEIKEQLIICEMETFKYFNKEMGARPKKKHAKTKAETRKKSPKNNELITAQ